MKRAVEARLAELRADYDAGRTALADIEGKVVDLRGDLLRIAGAIRVLEDLLQADSHSAAAD